MQIKCFCANFVLQAMNARRPGNDTSALVLQVTNADMRQLPSEEGRRRRPGKKSVIYPELCILGNVKLEIMNFWRQEKPKGPQNKLPVHCRPGLETRRLCTYNFAVREIYWVTLILSFVGLWLQRESCEARVKPCRVTNYPSCEQWQVLCCTCVGRTL